MRIFSFLLPVFLFFVSIASAQLKVVEIPEVPQKNGIRFDRFGSSAYFASYISGKNYYVSFYDADLKEVSKYQFPTPPVNISAPMYSSSDGLLCLAYYRTTGKSSMDATLFTFNTKGEFQGTKQLKGSSIMEMMVYNDKVIVILNNAIKETLTVSNFDQALNETWFKSIPFPDAYPEEVRGFIASKDEIFVTTSYTEHDGARAIKIFGLNMNDGNQFLTYTKRTEDQVYYFNSGEKEADHYTFIGESVSSTLLSDGVAGSGIFKLIINNKGEREDFTLKTWPVLIPEMISNSGKSNIFSSFTGNTFSIGLDKIIHQGDGYILVCHDYDKFRAVYTDHSFSVQKVIDLRQLESDKGEYVYEYIFCSSTGNELPKWVYMTDDVDDVPAVFISDLANPATGGKKIMKIDGSSNGPSFKSVNESLQRGFTNNLPAVNSSIISSSCNQIILFENYNVEKDAARIYLYQLK